MLLNLSSDKRSDCLSGIDPKRRYCRSRPNLISLPWWTSTESIQAHRSPASRSRPRCMRGKPDWAEAIVCPLLRSRDEESLRRAEPMAESLLGGPLQILQPGDVFHPAAVGWILRRFSIPAAEPPFRLAIATRPRLRARLRSGAGEGVQHVAGKVKRFVPRAVGMMLDDGPDRPEPIVAAGAKIPISPE
jgi:hypothetical protein